MQLLKAVETQVKRQAARSDRLENELAGPEAGGKLWTGTSRCDAGAIFAFCTLCVQSYERR